MGSPKVTADKIVEIQDIYARTKSKTETARLIGLSLTTINRYTKKYKQLYTDEDKEAVLQVYHSNPMTLKNIASQLGFSTSFVQRVLKDLPKKSVPPKKNMASVVKVPANRKIKRKIPKQSKSDEIITLYKKGISLTNIATRLNVSYESCRRSVIVAGIYKEDIAGMDVKPVIKDRTTGKVKVQLDHKTWIYMPSSITDLAEIEAFKQRKRKLLRIV